MCFAYIFGELGVFLSKTVSQVQFTKTRAFWRLSWLQANFHESSTLFITKSTFSYQKAQKTKVAQNHAKQFSVGPILCFAYIFGELGVFLSKTVSQVQFDKTIAFWRLFITKSTFSYQKAQKPKVAQNYAKQILVGPILCFAYIFSELGVFFPKRLVRFSLTKQ